MNEVHDEIVLEVPLDRVHDCASAAHVLWLNGARPYLPDVPPTAEPKAMTVWSKNSEAVYENGRLVPWVPATLGAA